MKTSDIFAAIETAKKNKEIKKEQLCKLQQDVKEIWKEFSYALNQVQHLICVEDFKITDDGLYWGDCNYHLKVSYDFDNPTNCYFEYKSPNYIDNHYHFTKLSKKAFEETILAFCIQHVKSEEEARDWHEKQKERKSSVKKFVAVVEKEEEKNDPPQKAWWRIFG